MTAKSRLYLFLFLGFICGMAQGNYDWNDNPGDGTAEHPYQISTAEQLASIGSNADLLGKAFILVNDINMSGYTFDNSPIAPDTDQSDNGSMGENKFSGSFNGNGYRIRNLTISRSGSGFNIGLVGLTTSAPWEIKNLALRNVSINVGNTSDSVGALVGRAYGGTISSCYATGSISGGSTCKYMGGLVGFASAANISNCYNECSVHNGPDSTYTGGAVGYLVASTARLDKCYSIGTVNSESDATSIGALVGGAFSGAQVNDCYYLNTAGPNNIYGTARTAAQLKLQTTYTNWDFVDDTPGFWRMRLDKSDYPYLAWEFITTDFYADFRIDMQDYAEFSQSWQYDQNELEYNWLCDLNENGIIDAGDFRMFCDDWLVTY